MIRRIKDSSPAMVVAIIALIAAVAGTSFAGVATISALNKGEKKEVKKIVKKNAYTKANADARFLQGGEVLTSQATATNLLSNFQPNGAFTSVLNHSVTVPSAGTLLIWGSVALEDGNERQHPRRVATAGGRRPGRGHTAERGPGWPGGPAHLLQHLNDAHRPGDGWSGHPLARSRRAQPGGRRHCGRGTLDHDAVHSQLGDVCPRRLALGPAAAGGCRGGGPWRRAPDLAVLPEMTKPGHRCGVSAVGRGQLLRLVSNSSRDWRASGSDGASRRARRRIPRGADSRRRSRSGEPPCLLPRSHRRPRTGLTPTCEGLLGSGLANGAAFHAKQRCRRSRPGVGFA